MSKAVHLVALALAIAVLAACSSGGGDASPTNTPAGATTSDGQPPSNTPLSSTPVAVTPSAETDAAVEAIRDDLLERLEVTANDIQLVSINEQNWPDACLGAAEVDEACAAVITPGYAIVVRVAETTYTYRTDKTGENVRFAGITIDSGN